MTMSARTPTLSPEMQRCLDFVQRQGGSIHRHQGGYWAAQDWKFSTGEYFGTTTVEALVSRAVLVYSEWKDNRFPIAATLLVEKEEVTA
ncbi:MAG: hypothetical protein OEV08_05120 [Nitrospira sp.]|nr:hypothetical protein [Nitrospira sp.]